jgi:hypothetical protein
MKHETTEIANYFQKLQKQPKSIFYYQANYIGITIVKSEEETNQG